MNARLLLFATSFATVFLAHAGNKPFAYKTDVTVDGMCTEWQTPLPRYHSITGLQYDIANDERNIYMVVRVADSTSQRQILQNGLEVWINQDGKKKNTTGILYPMAPDKPKAGTRNNPLVGMRADGFPNNIQELTLKGFLLENGRQPVKGCPVKVAIRKDTSGCIVYELVIPFNTFYKEKLEMDDLKRTFYIGFVVKGVTLDDATVGSMFAMRAMSGEFHGEGRRMVGMAGVMAMMGDVDKVCWQKIRFRLP